MLDKKRLEIKLKSKLKANVPDTIINEDSIEDKAVRRKMEEKYNEFEQIFAVLVSRYWLISGRLRGLRVIVSNFDYKN